jgi:hypothetical protein
MYQEEEDEQGGLYICQQEETNVFIRIVPCWRHCFPATSSLVKFSVVTSLGRRCFLPACLSLWEAFCVWPPSFSVVFEIFLLAWGSRTCFGVRDWAPGVLLMLPRLRCFDVLFIKFWQRHATVLLSFLWAWSLPVLFMYNLNVCSGNVTLLYVCVCFYWKSEYFVYCFSDSCYWLLPNSKLVDNLSLLVWDSPTVSASKRVLSGTRE